MNFRVTSTAVFPSKNALGQPSLSQSFRAFEVHPNRESRPAGENDRRTAKRRFSDEMSTYGQYLLLLQDPCA
jgi:hypothetical protein